jgi:hypothetical protein
MPSLVLELQQEALDPKIGVVDLLRKAYVVAVKLNLGQFKEWIDLESKGYAGSGKELPQYRRAHGILRVHNPFHGYQPFIIQQPEIAEQVSQAWLNNPLSEIEAVAHESNSGSHVALAFPPGLRDALMRGMSSPVPLEPSLHVARTAYAHVLHAVRDAVLKWSLELEKDGIIGEGMSFTSEEKKIAAQKEGELARVVNITVVGEMNNSSLQQGSERASQNHSHR